MGCVNSNNTKLPIKGLPRQQLDIQNSLKIKIIQSKKYQNNDNQNLKTHDSFHQDHSNQLQTDFHPQNPFNSQQINNIQKKQGKRRITKLKKVENPKNQLTQNHQINSQTIINNLVKRGEIADFLSQGSSQSRKYKNSNQNMYLDQIEQNLCQREQKIQRNHVKSDSYKIPNKQKQQKIENRNKEQSLDNYSINTLIQSARIKRPGFRSPRGRSCNLFKTFEGDQIEGDNKRDVFEEQSKSMQQLKN